MALPRDPNTPTVPMQGPPSTPGQAGYVTPKPTPKPAAAKAAAKPAAAKPTAAPKTGAFTVDSFVAALRMQESGGNYTSRSGSSTASGAYQYLDSTWNNYGGYAHAWQAPQSVQDARARADVTAALKKYNGDWQKVAAAHFAGQGWVDAHPDKSTWNQNPVPGSQNPTVSGYVNSLYSKAGQKGTVTNASGGAAGTPQNINDQVASQYGYLAAFLDDPEIGPILKQAAQEGWDSSRLQGAIYKTRWYKNHSDATRQFDSQTRLDPATQKADIGKRAIDIVAQAKRAGITLDQKAVAQLAWTSLRYGWSDQQLTNGIVAQGKMDLQGPGGASETVAQLKQQAAQYMVPISDQQMNTWVKQIQSGQLAVSDFDGYLKEQAKSLFPGLSSAIDRGVTVEQYADPYRQAAAQILEVDPQSIDFMHDSKYKPALFQVDPKTGQRTSMSLADWDVYLRKQPEYAKTAQANQQAAQFGNSLLQQFGAIAQ